MYASSRGGLRGTRKFEAQLRPALDPDMARDVQRTMALASLAIVRWTSWPMSGSRAGSELGLELASPFEDRRELGVHVQLVRLFLHARSGSEAVSECSSSGSLNINVMPAYRGRAILRRGTSVEKMRDADV